MIGVSAYCGEVGKALKIGRHRIKLEFADGRRCNFGRWELERRDDR